MKNVNLIEMLRGCSKRNGMAVSASNPDGQPTVNRQSRLMSHQGYLRNLAMIFAVLVMSMANVGMAWGGTITWDFGNETSSFTKGTDKNFTGSDGKTVLTYKSPDGDSFAGDEPNKYLKMGGASKVSSNIYNVRYFELTAPSKAGTISITYAADNATNASIHTNTNNGVLRTTITATASTKCTSSSIGGLVAGTTKIQIAFPTKAYIKAVEWNDVDAPTRSYYSVVKTTLETGAALSLSPSACASEQSGGSGLLTDFAKYYSLSNKAGTLTITPSSPITLNSNGSNRGCIRIYYGGQPFSLNVNGVATGSSYTVYNSTYINVAEYTIPNGTTSLASFTMVGTGSSTGGKFYAVEVLTWPAAGCTAPNHVDISGDWDKFGGETISLTATAYSSTGTGSPIADGNITGWQWQKLVGSTWTNLTNGTADGVTTSGATTKNLQISNCGQGNSGKYRCVVSTGATCSTASATATDGSEGYGVKVYVLECYNGGTTVYNFTRDGENQRGSVEIELSASTAYQFKFHVDNEYFGNNASITGDITNYVFCNSNNGGDCASNFTVNSGSAGGKFIFTMDYSTGGNSSVLGEPELSVTYPRKRIYMRPSLGPDGWTKDSPKFFIHSWGMSNCDALMAEVSTCDAGVYYADIYASNTECLFTRQSSSDESINTSSPWNKSDDITISTNNYFSNTGWGTSFTGGSFSPTTYEISFDGNGETSGSMTDVEDIECDASVTLAANAFEKTGYTFTGWKDASSNDYANEATISNITADIALTAQWSAKQCTVSFNTNGGSGTITSVTATYDAAMPTKAGNLPTKSGYDFAGFWDGEGGTGTQYYNADGTSAQNWDKNTTSNTTLYAKWTAHVYTVTLDLEGGSGTTSVIATYNATLSGDALFDAPTFSGYTFGGFYTEEAGGGSELINSNRKWNKSKTGYIDSDKKWIYTDDITLKAKWTQTVTLDDNGGSADGSADVVLKATSASTPSAPTYAGHTVVGYYADDGGANLVMSTAGALSNYTGYVSGGKWVHSGATTLYAHWKCNTPSISFASATNTVTITIPNGTKVYYTTDGSVPDDEGTEYSEAFTIDADCTVKAIAIQSDCDDSNVASLECDYSVTYTVTYTTTGSTGGTAPSDASSPYESGSTVTVKGNTGSLVKTGYVFLGWSDGSGNNYAPGETFTISANTTLSPIWKEGTSATITYTMAVGDKAWSASGSSNETTGIPNAGVTITTTNAGISGNGTGSRTSKLAIKTGANGATYDSPTNYILYNFSVASGYAFTPSDITIQIANVGSSSANNIKYKAVLSDASSHSISTTYICTTGNGTVETFHLYNEEGVTFDGSVSLKLWAWTIADKSDGGSAYRLGTPLTIAGVTESTTTLYDISTSATNGTIAVTVGGESASSAEEDATVTITATPSSGYSFSSWSVAEDDSDPVLVTSATTNPTTFTMPAADVTVTATFTAINYTLTWDLAGGTVTTAGTGAAVDATGTPSSSVAYGSSITAPTVTKTGYTFAGWSSDVASTMPATNTTYTATWTAKTTTITIDDNDEYHGSTTPGTVTATWGSVLPSFTAAAGESGYSLTGYFTTATSGTKVINANGTLVVSTDYADGSGNWKYETATLTLFPQYEEEGCTPQSLSKVVLSASGKSVIGTATGYNYGQYTGTPEVKADYDKTDATDIDDEDGDETGYKMGSDGNSIVFATLKGTSFQEGDVVKIGITRRNDTREISSNKNILTIYYGNSKSDADSLTTISTGDITTAGASAHEGAGFYEYELTAADATKIGSKKGIGLFRASKNGENPYVYSVEIIGCREWSTCTAPTAVSAGTITSSGATFTITDAENTNNYEIYYSTSSTAPTAETSATVSGISSKSRAVTGLTASTTYYYWVRSNCGGATKSSWVAGTPASFTTSAAASTYSVTYSATDKTSGSVPTDASTYEEGDIVTVKGNTGSLAKTGYSFVGWNTASDGTGTFYPAGYKFYMGDADVTLYAVWGSTGATCVTLTDFETGSHDKSSGKPDSEGKYFYGYKGTKNAAYAVTITTPGTGTVGANSGDNLQMAQNTRFNIYADNTTTGGTPATFSSITSISFKIKAVKNTRIPTIDVYVGSTKVGTVIGGDESKSDGHEYDTSDYTTISITGLASLSGIVKFVNTSSGSSDYKALFDDIQICYGSGAASGFTVSFNMNGKGSAIADIENVPSGSKIGAPVPSPTAAGVEFGGWYGEAGCTNAWNFGSSTITKDTTLYAKWTDCAPTISVDPSDAEYTQNAAATALSVTASGDGIAYQWYSSETNETIEGSSAIPGATSASYTPSTTLLGTIYYFCVVSNTCGNAVSDFAGITVNDSKPAPTAVWTIEEPKEGGKGFTFSIEVNKNNGDNWDGELLASMLTLSDNAILDGASIVVNTTNKTISGTYGVKAGSSSPVTFYLLLPATTSQSATRLDHDRTFTPCADGAGDNYTVPVRKDYEKDASNNYRWVTPGAGEITYAVGSSISSAKAASTVASVFDSIMSSDKQYVWVKTYEANTKTIRLYVETSGANVSVSNLYKNTVYATAADKDIVSSDDYSVSYDGSGSAENMGAKGTHYMDITFDSPLAANDIICVKFSSSKVKAYGAILTTVGDGGDQTTSLAWNTPSPSTPVTKNEDAADFSFTANRSNTAAQKSLGEISYSSSNTAVATVNATTGLVHIADAIDFGAAEYKEVTITATLAASGCYKKASITYTLRVKKYVCTEAAGTVSIKTDVSCSEKVLTVTGFEAGATFQWQKDGVDIPSATSQDYTATTSGEYSVVTTKTCAVASTNSIKLSVASATASKIVDSWYVKNGRRTPDIALVQTTGATSFTVTSGGTITEIGGCTFELKDDGIIYLHGQKEDGSAPSDMTAGDMTITITVSGCADELDGLDITIHKQAETSKPSVAFVVDGTPRKDGGTATSVSEAKTSDRDLWKYLNNTFTLTGCNAYWSVDSKELRQYYSQFDAILITDDPSTDTKGTGGVSYVKAFGTMVDVRPVLTLEAFVGKFKDGGWHVYDATPTSPNPRQVEMKLECKNHDIFKGLDPETSDNVRVTRDEYDNEYWHVIMVDTTVAPYHNTSKDYKALPALQGFDPHKFDHMLGVGTIADETLQGGVERQEEPAARMMILGIQNEAMAALTNEGKLIVKNAIEYLLKTNMEDVNDCSNYFTGGPSGTGDNWATPENWSSGKVPDFESRVRILRPVVISGDTKAIVARVDIATSGKSKWLDGECTGSVTVNPRGALIVSGKIRRAEAPRFGIDDLMPTENDDLIVKAATDAPHRQGALIFDNSDGDTHAVVEMWNPSYWEVEGGKKKKYWSYVAVPIQEADIPNFFWHGFTYLYDETSGWIKKGDGTSLYPFQGIGASLQDGNMETFYGPLATTESQDITLTYTADKGQGMNLIGNSWTAPIQIANFEEDDFGDAAAEVWVFNTGNKNDGTPGSGSSTTEGQWNTIPINAPSLPGYEGLKVIPAMQAFEVNTESETTLHLDYDRLVRAGRENLNEPMRAPRRSAAKQIEATMRVRVSGELTHTDVYLLKDARFSDGFDNGWDGHYLSGDDRSAKLYAISEEEGKLAFLAQPEIEGTQLGFAPSKHCNEYTFSFSYDGDEEYYLNDIKLKTSTLISEESTYSFTYADGDTNRFYISRTPIDAPQTSTGVDNTGSGEVKARKFIYRDKMYIMINGRVYSADGALVK